MYCLTGFRSESDFDLLFRKYPAKTVFAGVLIPTTIWGSHSKVSGPRLWSWICGSNFLLANSGSVTFIRGTAQSVIDLTIFYADIKILSWSTLSSGTNSDHFSIFIDILVMIRQVIPIGHFLL